MGNWGQGTGTGNWDRELGAPNWGQDLGQGTGDKDLGAGNWTLRPRERVLLLAQVEPWAGGGRMLDERVGREDCQPILFPGCVCKRFVFFGSMLAGVGSASIFPLSMASGYSLAVCQQLPASHSNENKNAPK